ncbi:hypothetical protein EJ110_NYTH28262 [Nymphaea thermarum]|nr:hypothetical protein EJ110_NYTH28262 [Nymphaea thermarum]
MSGAPLDSKQVPAEHIELLSYGYHCPILWRENPDRLVVCMTRELHCSCFNLLWIEGSSALKSSLYGHHLFSTSLDLLGFRCDQRGGDFDRQRLFFEDFEPFSEEDSSCSNSRYNCTDWMRLTDFSVSQ